MPSSHLLCCSTSGNSVFICLVTRRSSLEDAWVAATNEPTADGRGRGGRVEEGGGRREEGREKNHLFCGLKTTMTRRAGGQRPRAARPTSCYALGGSRWGEVASQWRYSVIQNKYKYSFENVSWIRRKI